MLLKYFYYFALHNQITKPMLNFENKYITASVDKSKKMLSLTWQPETENMSNEEFKEILLKLVDMVLQNDVEFWLGDTKLFNFIIEPEVQEWILPNYNEKLIAGGMKRMALIIPEQLFSEVSVTQTTEEMLEAAQNEMFQIKYFDSVKNAQEWLTENYSKVSV